MQPASAEHAPARWAEVIRANLVDLSGGSIIGAVLEAANCVQRQPHITQDAEKSAECEDGVLYYRASRTILYSHSVSGCELNECEHRQHDQDAAERKQTSGSAMDERQEEGDSSQETKSKELKRQTNQAEGDNGCFVLHQTRDYVHDPPLIYAVAPRVLSYTSVHAMRRD